MLFATSDISAVPAEFIKSALILAGFVIVIYMQWKNGQAHKREISGSVETRDAIEHAEQGDLDELTKTVNDMRIEITSQFRAAQQAGENRVTAITQNIDAEIGALAIKLSNLASVLHDKINAALVDNARQSSDITHLNAETFRHTNEIAAIRTAIQDLLKCGSKPKH